jgi:ERCC4-related helicase
MDYLKKITPREYQEKIFETCKEKNCLVVLPTGLGKTLIALMLTIERMKKYPLKKVLILAPTKPLIEQHLESFKKHLPELFGELTLFTGQVTKEKRKKLWQNSDIIFSTPQCIANDLKKNLYSLSEISLLVEDEAHRCVKNYDYNFIAQKYKSQGENQRIIGLTASPGSDENKIKHICKNLSIEEVELRTRESPDVKEYLQELEFEKIPVDLPSEFEEIRRILENLFERYIDQLKIRNVLFGPSTKTNLLKLQKRLILSLSKGNKNYNHMIAVSACAQAVKIQHAIELLETQTLESFHKYTQKLFKEASQKKSKGVQKLVAHPEFNLSHTKASELLTKGHEHPKLNTLKEIIEKELSKNKNGKIIIFSQFRDTASSIAERLNELKEINSKVFVGQTKKDGIGLSQKEQKKIIEEFKEGKINVLSATSIAEEGLDIPEVNAVIFYEPIPSGIRSIQRRGRTARLKKGKLMILITKNTRDESYYYVSRAKEKKMKRVIEEIKKDLSSKEKQKTLF